MSSRLLLDTNVLIWTITPSKKISGLARRALSRPNITLFVSVASVWELILKHESGKLRFEAGLTKVVDSVLHDSPWAILTIKPEHLLAVVSLPLLHKDPFDRLLIAQAQHEGLTIVTPDEQIPKYGVPTLW